MHSQLCRQTCATTHVRGIAPTSKIEAPSWHWWGPSIAFTPSCWIASTPSKECVLSLWPTEHVKKASKKHDQLTRPTHTHTHTSEQTDAMSLIPLEIEQVIGTNGSSIVWNASTGELVYPAGSLVVFYNVQKQMQTRWVYVCVCVCVCVYVYVSCKCACPLMYHMFSLSLTHTNKHTHTHS
jgi:hypothetical protein